MKSRGWLVNDCLTCIPNTKTFWHDLLENIEGLEDKTFGYTAFPKLAQKIERDLFWKKKPDYIIRNASFFRPIKTKVPQISLLQDYYNEEYFLKEQLPVINSSYATVINSPYIYNLVKPHIKNQNIVMIPMGVDSDFFNPQTIDSENLCNETKKIKPNSILFIGAATNWPKGFDILLNLVENTEYNFVFVMKDDYKTDNKRVIVFNKINQQKLKEIMHCCKMTVCTSKMETFHLAGVESMLMNMPVVAMNTGIYTEFEDCGEWGMKCNAKNIKDKVSYVFNNIPNFNSRKYILEKNLTKQNTMQKWNDLVKSIK